MSKDIKEYKSLGQNFVIYYNKTINGFEGKCYSTINWEDVKGKKGWNYCSSSEGGIGHEKLNDDCRCLFEFSLMWRGVWDERIYFKDDEYWAEELEKMYRFWEEIKLLLREQVRVIIGEELE